MNADTPASIGHRIVSGGLDLLRSRLLAEPPSLPLVPRRGDYDLNPQNRPSERVDLKPAAVLLPLIIRHEPHVLLTQRTHHLTRHAGQVAFPGGRADAADVSLVETALRETQEETGIDPAFVTVAGFLDAYETGTGYAILPVVGILSEGFALSPHAAEVAEIFEVPLSFLLDPRIPGPHAQLLFLHLRGSLHLGRDGRDAVEFRRADQRAMTRIILERLLLFAVPFALYGVYLLLMSMRPPPSTARATPWTMLFIAGLSLFALSFLIWGNTEGEPTTGRYVAPHVVNGVVVPGYVQPAEKPK